MAALRVLQPSVRALLGTWPGCPAPRSFASSESGAEGGGGPAVGVLRALIPGPDPSQHLLPELAEPWGH